MKQLFILLLTVAVAACQAEPDSELYDGEPLGWGGSSPAGGGGPCVDCGGGNVGGQGGEPVSGPREVCYPGPNKDFSVCVPVIPHSESWGEDYDYPVKPDDPRYQTPLYFVDLSAVDPDTPIAANFVLQEVMQESKGTYGVFQPHVVSYLQTIRETIGGALHVTSGYRSPGYNIICDGAQYSRHMFGDASDLWSSVASHSEIQTICLQLGAGYTDLYDNFVHCDWRNDPLEPAFYGPQSSQDMARAQALPELSARLEPPQRGRVSWRAPAEGFDEGEPLRQWTAYDRDGNLIEQAVGPEFEPPADAARIEVQVGSHLFLATDLSAAEPSFTRWPER